MKKLLLLAAGLFVFALLCLGLLGACVIHAGNRFSFSPDEQATRQETHPLEIAAGQTLRIDLDAGDVRVRAGDASGSLSARITAWGGTKEEAEAALAKAKLEISTSESGPTVSLAGATVQRGLLGMVQRNTAKADLEIAVPAGVHLRIESSSGDLDAQGPFDASTVHSSYGSVRIEKVEGDLAATSSSGDVVVAGAHGGSVEATSGYGQVRVSDCESTRITAKSSSGAVRLEDARAERFRIKSGYGDIEMARIDGEVEAKTSSGDIRAKDLKGPVESLATSYGRVQLENGAGKLAASSSSGDVFVTRFDGSVVARSGYGAVHVEGVLTEVSVESSSGDVSVTGGAGSTVSAPWRISSSYGRGQLELPAGLGFDIDARTNYGRIERGFPVELLPGTDERSSQAIQGKVNGGGGKIEIRCKGGDVIFRPSGK